MEDISVVINGVEYLMECETEVFDLVEVKGVRFKQLELCFDCAVCDYDYDLLEKYR